MEGSKGRDRGLQRKKREGGKGEDPRGIGRVRGNRRGRYGRGWTG
jgi:hypothetical protein